MPNDDEKIVESEQAEQDSRTEPERLADEKLGRLEIELASLQPGTQVILERQRPSWCKGQLEKLTIGEEGLDLDYLIRTWGGHLLSIKIVGAGGRIRGSHSIELYTFDPRRHGKILRAPNQPEENEPIPDRSLGNNGNNSLLPKILEMISSQRQSEVDTLKSIILAQQQQQPVASPQPHSAVGNINELVKTASALNQLKDMFRTDPALAESDDSFPGQIMDVLKMMLSKEQKPQLQSPSPTPSARIVGPAQPLKPLNDSGPTGHRKSGNVTDIRNPDELAKQLSAMNPEAAADTIMMAFGKMPPEKQARAMDVLYSFQDAAPGDEDEDDDDEDEGAETVEN